MFNQKFEPEDGKILHGAGQSPEAFLKYSKTVENFKPSIYMTYIRINEINEKLALKINRMKKINPKLMLQIGLNLKARNIGQQCKEIINKKYDSDLLCMIRLFKKLNRPVFLRIGYEFNNPAHNYKPKEFISAWKYIADLFKKNNCVNVAFVWDACSAFNKDIKEIMEYYPGDKHVDWFGNNLFGVQHFKDNSSKITEDFYKESINHKKPLMIAESSAIKSSDTKKKKSWNGWFVPYFSWIKSHPNTKAFCYINWDWGKDWKMPEWGNCRIEENEFVRKKYVKEMADKRYIHLSKTTSIFK
ncbi:hypothetical protein HYW76_04830 [Candidatus Pacearchaeota archaeon]|nr:hypothetical protein [Candidatus Pacearchaeota archaeon]